MEYTVKELQQKLLNNFYAFVHMLDIKKNEKTLIPNNKLYKEVCDNISNLNKNTMILLPRRHLKTLIASLFATWYIMKYPNNAVVLLTDTRKKGIRLLKGIKNFFQMHKIIKSIFPEYKLAQVGNNEDTLTLANRSSLAKEPNIAVYSIEQPIQSARADMLVLEDIVSDRFVKSEANREMVRYNLESIDAILEKDSKKVVTGTRYTINDPYNDIKEENEFTEEWNIISYGVYDTDYENSGVLCSYVMDKDEVEKIKRRHTEFFFASQYLNNPISNELNIFRIDLYERYKERPTTDDFEYIYMAVDLSDGSGGDKQSIITVGKDKNGKYYILDAFANNRINNVELYYTIKAMYNKVETKCVNIVIELNRNGKTVYNDTFKRLMAENSDMLPFSGVYNTENKNLRIEKLEPLFREGLLILPEKRNIPEGHGLQQLYKELTHFNYMMKDNEDDLIDALSMCIVAMQRRESTKRKVEKRKKKFIARKF